MQKNWIIIDDDHTKAEYFMQFICEKHGEDSISWVYTQKEVAPSPRKVSESKSEGYIYDKKRFNKKINFYWAHNKSEFKKYFNTCVGEKNNIILLDIETPALGNKGEPVGNTLKSEVQSFLNHKLQNSLITITSNKRQHTVVHEKIAKNDEKILTRGTKSWTFSGNISIDCASVIDATSEYWDDLYQNTLGIEEFIDLMQSKSSSSLHNWGEEKEKRKYIKKGVWNPEWDMPIQLGWLIKLLRYNKDKFIETFELKKDGYFHDKTFIANCLKKMVSKECSSISVGGALFICWAAYRSKFRDDSEGNEHFEAAIKSIEKYNIEGDYKSQNILTTIEKTNYITPPQKPETLKETLIALYKMVENLVAREKSGNTDLVQAVKLDETGLKIEFSDINQKIMHEYLSREYECMIKKQDNPKRGKTSKRIIDYLIKSGYSDKFIPSREDMSIIGTPSYGLKIISRGTENKSGIILKFGYGKK